MRVQLMLTCLCDAFYGEVGIATVNVLEQCGVAVEFSEDQTCCGQPPFNSGDWDASRRVIRHWLDVFSSELPVVTPSSSCAAMVRHGFSMLGIEEKLPKLFELSEFLVDQLNVSSWPSKGIEQRIAFHRACHGRGLGLSDQQERLLQMIEGVKLVPISRPEQCCGFGGSFSATHPTLSAEIGDDKIVQVVEADVDLLVSGDMGCLMHLSSLMRKQGVSMPAKHFAQVLAEAL